MDIPLDLCIEILTKLPAKSLMRFKCVSKLWSSLIRSRYFSNLRFKVALPPRIYISFMKHLECDSMKVCHNPGESVLVSLVSNDDISFDEELTMPGIGGDDMVALRGLILYTVCRTACIYNPTTRQSLTLHAIKSNIVSQEKHHKFVFYYFGYDPILDEYKIVCNVIYFGDYKSILLEHWVFVLEVGGSWKKVEFSQPHMPTKKELCINGVIYYLAHTSVLFDTVVSFDVRSEEFNMIQAPDDVPKFALSPGLIEYGGKPAILDQRKLVRSGSMELWVLEDGVKWSKKSLLLQQCQMHLLDNIAFVDVKGTTGNGEVILILRGASPSPCYILYYDLQKNDLRKINITREFWEYAKGFSDPYNWFCCFELMDNSENIMQLEI